MTYEEAFDNYVFMLGEVIKLAPAVHTPGLKAALEMANAAMEDIDEDN